MSLVTHDPKYRRIWMWPRNKRRIPSWAIANMLSIVKVQTSSETIVSGNIELQNIMTKAMESSGLKKAGEQYHPNPGGMRTYLSQLEGLGLIFYRPDRSLWFTLAGEDIVSGKPPLPILQTMILKYQYPSVYSMGAQVRINPSLKIKPYLFLLKLLMDPDIGYLTNKEIAIPVIYGHNNSCYALCKEKILLLRSGEEFENIIDSTSEDLYTPRGSSLQNIFDIANTFKNVLQSFCFIYTEKNGRIEQAYLNEELIPEIKKALKNENKFISMNGTEEWFQRTFGAWNRKDLRQLTKTQYTSRSELEKNIIAGHFASYCGTRLVTEVDDEFIDKMVESYGFDRQFIRDTASRLLSRSYSMFEERFIELSRSGDPRMALEFEKAVTTIFRDVLYFDAVETGQKKNYSSVGGYSDVFAVASDGIHCAIIDAKASPKYDLGSADWYKMKDNYIANYMDLAEGRPLELEFCSYVAGGFKGNIASKLRQLSEATGVGASAISASQLIRLAQKNPIPENQPTIREVFCKNKILTAEDFI
ncbi:MAG: hypothetical protein IE916_02250 [Epsilonproteobacteria bacterium]|nr:hypothetical protein [Campylobacterales bacterium]MBD3823313.1 hypothetical protein [Campylobacterota bacterium]